MDQEQAVTIFAALAHETRLAAFRLLAQAEPEGLPAGRIAQQLGVVQSTMSRHLAALANAGLIAAETIGPAARYRLQPQAMRTLAGLVAEEFSGGQDGPFGRSAPRGKQPYDLAWAAGRVFNVLFICTANSARSILAEAIVNHDHGARFRAYSAGSTPSGTVAPEALDLLRRLGYPTAGLRSKGWVEFSRRDAPVMDFVFTLCDEAAGETCPAWPGVPMTAHWGLPDPRAADGGDQGRAIAFAHAFRMIERRIGVFANLPFAGLERLALKKRLDDIGSDRSERG